jgi:phage terminase large subunit-like protein
MEPSRHEIEVEQYVDDVLSGRVVTGRLARLAVWRYQADRGRLEGVESAECRGYEFKASYANEFLDFSEVCCHTQGEWAGKPFVASPWQKFCDWNLFGWREAKTGFRRFREDYECLARKNGKTTRCAPKCFYLSIMDSPLEEGAQGYCAATKEDQAKLLFDELCRCRDKSPTLKKYSKAYQKRIVFPSTQSYMQVLGSDSDSQDGFNPHFIVRDELHAWQKRHRGLQEKLETGFGARRQPLTMTITTAGDDTSEIWIEEHEYAIRVLESVITGEIIDDTYFAYIAAIDDREMPCFRCHGNNCPWCGGTGVIPADDPLDERCWIKANPNLGMSPKIERLREKANKARHKPSAMNEWLRYHCNVRVTSTARLIPPESWAACTGELSDWSEATRIHGATDLGRSNDMAGSAVVARFDMTDDDGKEFKRFEIRSRAWTCADRHDDIKTPQVARWVNDDLIGECNGNQILIQDVEDWTVEQAAIYGTRTWAYDPNNALQFGQRLQEVHGLTVFPFSQNAFRYNEPTRTLERLLTETHIVDGREVRALCHDGDPILAWMMTNLIVRKNAKDEWMPDKGSSPQKIDIAVAVLMAIAECLFSDQVESASIYDRESRGFVEIG